VDLSPPAAQDAAFYFFFGVFVVGFVVLSVLTLRWAIRRDRAGRRAWLARRAGEVPPPPEP
jgi:hypothetical protein